MRFNIYHICPFGHGFNIGNFLIQQAVRRMVKRQCNGSVNFITIPAAGFGAKSGLTKKTIYDINQTASGVIIGGGNLFENGEIEFDKGALRALRKPMMVYSASYGNIYGPDLSYVRRTDAINDGDLVSLLEHADVVLSRDEATYNHIESLMHHPDHLVGGCPSIYISDLANREFSKHDPQGGRFPLLAVRNPDQMNIPLSQKMKMHHLSERSLNLLESRTNKPARVLCNDQRDIEYAMSFEREILYTSDVYEYFDILNSVEAAISFRVHTSLPLWSLGRPTLNLSYDERSESLINTLGMQACDLNIIERRDTILDDLKNHITTMPDIVAIPPCWDTLHDIQVEGVNRFLTKLRPVK